MLYLFYGDDVKNKILNYEKFIKGFPVEKKTPNIEIFYINKNNFDYTQIESFYSGSGLFFSKCILVFRDVLEKEDIKDFIFKNLGKMQASENSFVFLEGKLNKPIIEAFKKVDPKKVQINVFELPKEKKEKFDNFLLANAFSKKDKLNLWIYFRQAVDLGVGMEELIGVLFWKIKDMILKNDFSKYKKEDLNNYAFHLSYLLPEARKEGIDAEIAFEQFLLEVF